ncbi:MAG: endonuclease/exonuclease/phosphatase family protein [Lachnospiraceae bacterium]
MKILTINTHSLQEPEYEKKLQLFADVLLQEQPEVFGMQEVNQSMKAEEVIPADGYVACEGSGSVIRRDNHAHRLAQLLETKGLHYEWTWIGAKVGYGIYDEGMALFSLHPILDVSQFYISRSRSYTNWKTRKVLGIKTGERPAWYFCAHMGWWDDREEPFATQWDNFEAELKTRIKPYEKIWILGDFNSPAEIKGEGYEYLCKSGWKDSWQLAEEKDAGITVGKVIDGWRDRLSQETAGMRIDYIWCNQEASVMTSKIICNGINGPVVSDHYGVLIETGEF